MLYDNFISNFPESMFLPANPVEYRKICSRGYKQAENSSVFICGLVRNLKHPVCTFSRLKRIGELFGKYKICLYENDSTDNTLKWLNIWANDTNLFISEKLNKEQNEQDMSLKRRKDMAYYRNQYLKQVKLYNYDYTLVLDTDLDGGYSYEGIINSVGQNVDVTGSNGLLYRKNKDTNNKEKLYYDSWAYRKLNSDEHDPNYNLINHSRGTDLVEVNSCFGGMSLYKTHVLKGCEYQDWDCDHVTLHKQIKNNGYKVWMNPSQITLYTRHYYTY